MTTTVVNLRNQKADVIIDRRGKWGNPYRIGAPDPCNGVPMTRANVLMHYRADLYGVLVCDPDFLEPLRGQRLGCWCRPLPCHGDVIVELLEGKG